MKQEERNAAILYMISVIVCFCVGIKILYMVTGEVPKRVTSRMVEIIGISLFLIFVKVTPLKVYKTGLTAQPSEVKGALIRGGIISLCIILVFAAARIVMSHYDPAVGQRPWFKLYLGVHHRWTYIFTVILQEFMAKGVMQETMKKVMGEGHTVTAIFACALVFLSFHIAYPLYYIAGAGLLCIITGFVYEKDKCIWGCVLIHFCIGFLPRTMGLK